VVKARREQVEPYGDLIVGVDPASATGDRSAIAWRRGHAITKVKGYRGLDLMQLTGLIGKIIKEDRPARVALDVGGLGIGVYDRLRELGHSRSRVAGAEKFRALINTESMRRNNEVKVTGPAQWCNYQRANLEHLGIKEVFVEPRAKQPKIIAKSEGGTFVVPVE
jgi:hypothetical protein